MLGLAATVAVAIVVTRIAKRSLASAESSLQAAKESAEEQPPAPVDEKVEVLPQDEHNRELVSNVHPPGWKNPEPSERYNLVVIGAGTAGLVTAAGAAGLGARVALVGCPQDEIRSVLQEVVEDAEELPHSSIGGPWALDAPINRGSYLFNFGEVTEETVDDWIHLVQELGFNQLDFHGGRSFRFGDCRPDPDMYPRGLESLKAVVDRLHAEGIAAGLHTYAT